MKTLEQLKADFDAVCAHVGGCTNGDCLIVRPKGMHTNGSCHCYNDKMKAQRIMRAAWLLRRGLDQLTGVA